MKRILWALIRAPFRYHLLLVLAVLFGVVWVIFFQITDRANFADSELYSDVLQRWGAPIVQPAPSVRYVESGAVFNTLDALPLARQSIDVSARMNYRKRGLVYFSGFDFTFDGQFEAVNTQDHDIDTVFVFPIRMQKNQVLLSDLRFSVNDQPADLDLAMSQDKLVWTGRMRPGERVTYRISFSGRGLDAFTYLLDPDLRVNDFSLSLKVQGGDNYDYQTGVVPANEATSEKDTISLKWAYGSLESGVPVGLILPSEQSFDTIIATLLRRSLVPFFLFYLAVLALAHSLGRRLRFYEAGLLSAGYALFFVLSAYLAAFMHFYLAFGLSLVVVGALLVGYLRALLGLPLRVGLGLVAAFLAVPNLAVVFQGYTGLIYTLEITCGILGLMYLTTRQRFRGLIDSLLKSELTEGEAHGNSNA